MSQFPLVLRRATALVLVLILPLLIGPVGNTTAYARPPGLAPSDLQVIHTASVLAARSPSRALSWLAHRHDGTTASMSSDGTILVKLPDDRRVAVLRPGHTRPTLLQIRLRKFAVLRAHPRQNVSTNGSRAIVLQPFADELGLGSSAGQAEADALSAAGFSVEVKRNAEVSIPVMETLGSYSFVYMETHSGLLPNGDAIVVTGDTHIRSYSALAPVASGGDGSLMEATVAGDPNRNLYIAVTAAFVNQHVAPFGPRSVVFLNGCSLLRAPVFWQALEKKGVGAMISWDQEADVNVTEPAAKVVINRLVSDGSVGDSISAAYAAGVGESPAILPAYLGLLGDSSIMLNVTAPRATSTAIPAPATATVSPTPTALPTVTPTATGTATPSFSLELVALRFEKNTTKGNATKRRITSVHPGSKVRLTAYYSASGSTYGCTYTATFTLKFGTRRIHSWTRHVACRTGLGNTSVFGVKLSQRGKYTLLARVVLNSGSAYAGRTYLVVR